MPVLVDGQNSGDLKFYDMHNFGYDGISPSQSPKYYPKWGACDYSLQHGGTFDTFDHPYLDTQTQGGFDLKTTNIQINDPVFYWAQGAPFSAADNLFTMENLGEVNDANVVMANPVCFRPPYARTAAAYTNLTSHPTTIPIITGGYGCHTTNNQEGRWETMSPAWLDYDANGPLLNLGTGAGATNYVEVSGNRFELGYLSGTGPVLGPSASLCTNASGFGTGCFGAITSNYFHFGGSRYFDHPNYSLDTNGIQATTYVGLASASTVAPTTYVSEIKGTATITTITPPSGSCTTGSTACWLVFHSVNGFTLGTGGNLGIASNVTVPPGYTVSLQYLPNLSLWVVPAVVGTIAGSQIPAALPNTTSVNNTKIPANATLATAVARKDSTCNSATGVYCAEQTGLKAAVSTTTAFTTNASGPCSAGQYRVTSDIRVTGNAQRGETLDLNFTAPNEAGSFHFGPSVSTTTAGTAASSVLSTFVNASTAITYNTTLSAGATWPTYALDITVECLQ